MTIFYCNRCKYLSVSEVVQQKIYEETGIREQHICNFYNKQVKHLGHHPNILRLPECEQFEPFSFLQTEPID